MGKTIFVTTGATVVFEELLDIVLDPIFLGSLEEFGYTKFILQYGIAPKGEEIFLKNLVKYSKVKNNDKWEVIRKGLTIEGIAFTNDIKSIILESDVIISHAGTGSILDVLRLNKKLIVVINSKLMNDHQTEVADELSKNHHLLKCNTDMAQLISNLKIIDAITFKSLPIPNGRIFQEILQSL